MKSINTPKTHPLRIPCCLKHRHKVFLARQLIREQKETCKSKSKIFDSFHENSFSATSFSQLLSISTSHNSYWKMYTLQYDFELNINLKKHKNVANYKTLKTHWNVSPQDQPSQIQSPYQSRFPANIHYSESNLIAICVISIEDLRTS